MPDPRQLTDWLRHTLSGGFRLMRTDVLPSNDCSEDRTQKILFLDRLRLGLPLHHYQGQPSISTPHETGEFGTALRCSRGNSRQPHDLYPVDPGRPPIGGRFQDMVDTLFQIVQVVRRIDVLISSALVGNQCCRARRRCAEDEIFFRGTSNRVLLDFADLGAPARPSSTGFRTLVRLRRA